MHASQRGSQHAHSLRLSPHEYLLGTACLAPANKHTSSTSQESIVQQAFYWGRRGQQAGSLSSNRPSQPPHRQYLPTLKMQRCNALAQSRWFTWYDVAYVWFPTHLTPNLTKPPLTPVAYPMLHRCITAQLPCWLALHYHSWCSTHACTAPRRFPCYTHCCLPPCCPTTAWAPPVPSPTCPALLVLSHACLLSTAAASLATALTRPCACAAGIVVHFPRLFSSLQSIVPAQGCYILTGLLNSCLHSRQLLHH
jgi:hypothetical protein